MPHNDKLRLQLKLRKRKRDSGHSGGCGKTPTRATTVLGVERPAVICVP